MQYKVGDIVEWTSQAGGNSKHKKGTVIRVIQPGENIREALSKEKLPTDRIEWGGGTMRVDVCYIVRVDPGERKKDVLYVPRVKDLKPWSPTGHVVVKESGLRDADCICVPPVGNWDPEVETNE